MKIASIALEIYLIKHSKTNKNYLPVYFKHAKTSSEIFVWNGKRELNTKHQPHKTMQLYTTDNAAGIKTTQNKKIWK